MKKIYALILMVFLFISYSCTTKRSEDESRYRAFPKVFSTHITRGKIMEYTEMNAMSRYMKTSVVSSPLDGYILQSRAKMNQVSRPGEILFIVQTRESRALNQNRTLTENVPGLAGTDTITSGIEGYVTEIFFQKGDFVTMGEKLLTMKETSSLVFVLDIPYEWKNIISIDKTVDLILPDETRIRGTVSQISPEVNSVNQTQKILISVPHPDQYPEGLIARVLIPKAESTDATLLPRDAVLTNETESEYWVMKMINDSMAVKVPVKVGIMNPDTVEILQPDFGRKDRILIYGNYAVPDTIQVNLTDPVQ